MDSSHGTVRELACGGASPYNMLFGREPRTQLDELVLTWDDATFGVGLERTVIDKRQLVSKVCEAFIQRQVAKYRSVTILTPELLVRH